MTRVLIAYETGEGQTATIAEVLADVLRERLHETDVVEVKRLGGIVPHGYDAVIVGASIHMGRHGRAAVEFVQQNRDVLERLPAAFFSVSLAAEGDLEEAEGYVEQFEQATGWRPGLVALFGGALLYTHYGFVKRRMMRRIVKDKPGNLGLDTSRDYVYTEWDAVRRFGEHFADQLESVSGDAHHGLSM